MFEELLAYGAVLGATTYATWRLMPCALRVALAERWATLAPRFGFADADADPARRQASASGSSTCGGCSGCASKPTSIKVVVVTNKNTNAQ